jgi:hypothetical protein
VFEFIKRLGITIVSILGFVVISAIFLAIGYLGTVNGVFKLIIQIIVCSVFGLFGLLVLIGFIYWLFIEPFTMNKKSK